MSFNGNRRASLEHLSSNTQSSTQSQIQSLTQTQSLTKSSTRLSTKSSTQPLTKSSTRPLTKSSTQPSTKSSTHTSSKSSAQPSTESQIESHSTLLSQSHYTRTEVLLENVLFPMDLTSLLKEDSQTSIQANHIDSKCTSSIFFLAYDAINDPVLILSEQSLNVIHGKAALLLLYHHSSFIIQSILCIHFISLIQTHSLYLIHLIHSILFTPSHPLHLIHSVSSFIYSCVHEFIIFLILIGNLKAIQAFGYKSFNETPLYKLFPDFNTDTKLKDEQHLKSQKGIHKKGVFLCYDISVGIFPQSQQSPDSKLWVLSLSKTHVPVSHSRYTQEFDELSLIGKGGFGKVFRVKNRVDQQEYAIKQGTSYS